jgi:hypothetical protein
MESSGGGAPEAWEQCKENYVPVKTGRSAEALRADGKAGSDDVEAKKKCVCFSDGRAWRRAWVGGELRAPAVVFFTILLQNQTNRQLWEEIRAEKDDPLPIWLK